MFEDELQNNTEYIKEIIQTAKNRGIDVIIITLPVSDLYLRNISSGEYEIMQKELTKISENYDVQYFNFMNDSRFNYKDFSDYDHMNQIGANKFSALLKNEILLKYIK